ncbi:MAG: helix-turn-helix domain-containing protein [Lachnospira eligens]
MNQAFPRNLRLLQASDSEKYLIYVRTHAAADLLVNTSLSITEIADKCGFADSNTMGGTFKKIMGEAPGSFTERAINYIFLFWNGGYYGRFYFT